VNVGVCTAHRSVSLEATFGVTTPHVEITKKLHNLRTQINNGVRKIKNKKSGEGADDVVFTSNWEFFNSILFMMGGMTRENTQSDILKKFR
jgi:hypothetical protein